MPISPRLWQPKLDQPSPVFQVSFQPQHKSRSIKQGTLNMATWQAPVITTESVSMEVTMYFSAED